MHEDQQNCFVLECCCPAPPSAANIHAIAWGLLVTLAPIVLPSLPFPLLATKRRMLHLRVPAGSAGDPPPLLTELDMGLLEAEIHSVLNICVS